MRQRSLFGPLLLIAAGAVWLLISLNVIPAANLWALGQLLPYLLMALGLGLLLRTRWAVAGWIMSALVVTGAFLAVLFAPQLGWNRPLRWAIDPGFTGGVQGSGNVATEARELDDFHAVSIKYPAEFVIRQTDSQSVEIEAEDNLIPQLATEIRNGVLYIENSEQDWTRRVDPSKPVRITISVKDLQEIDFSSAGSLQVDELATDQLKLVLSGAGEVRLNKLDVRKLDSVLSGAGNIKAEGTADEIKLIISGFGSFKAPELASMKADIHISGAGNATVRVSDDLTATVSGAGSVDYYGSPHIVQHISGAGSVNQAED